jgi:hypothetical protein
MMVRLSFVMSCVASEKDESDGLEQYEQVWDNMDRVYKQPLWSLCGDYMESQRRSYGAL